MYVFGSVGDVGVRRLCLGFTNPVGSGWVWDVCLCLDCGGVEGVGCWLGPGSGRVMLCYVCVCCESGLFVWMAGPGICILC